MTLPAFDGAAIDLRVNPDRYISGGALATLDGGLLTWSVNSAVSGHIAVFGQGLTREVDTIGHSVGTAATLNLHIRNKPTYALDFDQLSNGNVLVSWVEPNSPGSSSYFRIYDTSGRALTPKTAFAPFGNDGFDTVRLTALQDGGFCGVFGEYRNGSSESFFQVFTADGTATTTAIRMNPTLAGDQDPLGVTDLGGGQLQAMWRDRQPTGEESLMVRLFSTTGAPLGKAIVVMTEATESYFTEVQSVALENGNVIVTWHLADPTDTAPETLFGRILGGDGKPVGAAFEIASAPGTESTNQGLGGSSVVALQDGRWMVAWTEEDFDAANFALTYRVLGRIYDADGTLSEDTFDLAPGQTNVGDPKLTVLADGRVAVHYSAAAINMDDAATIQIIDPRLAAVSLTGTTFGDQLQGTNFGDGISGGTGRDKLAGMAGNDLLSGGTHVDTLLGGDGNDTLYGGADNDLLLGGAGNDSLISGLGDDILTGGIGRDTFVFGRGSNADSITDFNAALDKLDLQAFGFISTSAALSHVTQTAEGAQFAFGTDTVLMVGVDVATLGAEALIL